MPEPITRRTLIAGLASAPLVAFGQDTKLGPTEGEYDRTKEPDFKPSWKKPILPLPSVPPAADPHEPPSVTAQR